jgi:hypothetical protein
MIGITTVSLPRTNGIKAGITRRAQLPCIKRSPTKQSRTTLRTHLIIGPWAQTARPGKPNICRVAIQRILLQKFVITDPDTLEWLACREATALAPDLALSKMTVALDCKNVLSDIVEGTMWRFAAIITVINWALDSFKPVLFFHDGRASNFKAHNLANLVLTSEVGCHLWLSTPILLQFL